jgi:hypothetical protein
MSMTKLKLCIIIAITVASVATPWVLRHRADIVLAQKAEALRQQADQLARLGVESNRLSNLTASAKSSRPLSNEQLLELLRLRSELGKLRLQTSAIQRLQEENSRLELRSSAAQNANTPKSVGERIEDLSRDTIGAMKDILAELSAVTESVPPGNEMKGFKMYHLDGCRRAAH